MHFELAIPMDIFRTVKALDVDAVRQYLADGGDPNERNCSGETLLYVVCLDRRVRSMQIADMLINAGADPNARVTHSKRVPLHVARADMMRRLLKAGANPSARDKDGSTPIHNAFSAEEVHVLAQAGASVNTTDACGFTPLYSVVLSVRVGDNEIVTALLDAGADPNIRTNFGYSALDIALIYRNDSMVWLLLQGGADPNGRVATGTPPIMSLLAAGGLRQCALVIRKRRLPVDALPPALARAVQTLGL